jgi:hypothetical protein
MIDIDYSILTDGKEITNQRQLAEVIVADKKLSAIEQMMQDTPTASRYISMNPSYAGDSVATDRTAPDNMMERFDENPEIDLDKLKALARAQGVLDDPRVQKTINSIRTYEKTLLLKAQSKECKEDCNLDVACCQSNCELFELMVERVREKWLEDKLTNFDSCKYCKYKDVNCQGIKNEEVTCRVKKAKFNLKEKMEDYMKLPLKQQNEVIKRGCTKGIDKTFKIVPMTVNEIEIEIDTIKKEISPKAFLELDMSDIDKIKYRDYEELKDKLSEDTINEIADYMMSEIQRVIERNDNGENFQAILDRAVEQIKENKKQQIEDTRSKIELVDAEMRNKKRLPVTKDYITNAKETFISCLVACNGKMKANGGATGAVINAYQSMPLYINKCANSNSWKGEDLLGNIQQVRNRGKMVMHLFAKKGNYGEDIDYDLFRDIIKRLVRMVENSRIENKTIAIPRFNFGNFKKMENIMIVLSENTSVEFKVYHPWD